MVIIHKCNLNFFVNVFYNLLKLIFFLNIFIYQLHPSILNNLLLYSNNVNTSLINGVVLIHPILIYLTYFLLIVNFMFLKNNFYKVNFVIFIFKKNILIIALCSFLALFLGGWWAQQELNWGGWWNWDFVELIALIFFIITLYILHNNFFKIYNNFFIINNVIYFYLICFFLFVRIDVLNSIHSFNSFSILNNFNNYLIFLFIFIIFLINSISINFFKKFKFFKNLVFILSLFFKLTNYIFIMYFLLNIFVVIYLNYQFIDITKYIKLLLLLLLYIYVLYEFKNKFIISLLLIYSFVFIFYYNLYISIFNLFIINNVLITFKNFKFNNFIYVLSHICFFFFILYIKYNWIQLYINTHKYILDFNNFLLNSDYLLHNNFNNYIINYNSAFYFNLNSFYQFTLFNNLFFLKEIYINNIIVDCNSFGIYNFDNLIFLLFYNIQLILYLILILIIF